MDFISLAKSEKLPKEFQNLLQRQPFAPLPLWNRQTNQTKFIFEFASNQTIFLGLYFLGKPNLAPYPSKSFAEGLWNYDLVEAFLALDNKRYLELNLSINGAWWSAQFNDYRDRDNSIPPIKLNELVTYSKENSNLVLASFNYQNLVLNGQFNISAIVAKQHYSLNPALANSKPDFHIRELRR